MNKNDNKTTLATEMINDLKDKINFYRVITGILTLAIILLFIIKI